MTRALFAASAAFALAYALLHVGAPGQPMAASLIKTLPVALLALAGWQARVPAPVWLGLALGALGDFLLSRPGEASFIAGMGAFAAGHLAYVAAFGLRRPPVAVALALLVLALSTEVWLAPHAGALVWPVRGYVLVICLMTAMASARPDRVLWAGAGLFLLSDLMLAIRLFVLTEGALSLPLSHAVWGFYWLGQALILTAFLRARRP